MAIYIICCNTAVAQAVKTKNIISNAPYTNKDFVGRTEEIKFIREYFVNNTSNPILALVGNAGIGKSQIAKKYLSLHKDKHDIIWWIDADKNITIQLINLIQEWNSNTQVTKENYIHIDEVDTDLTIQRLKNALTNTKLSWILVFDNASKKEEIDEYVNIKHSMHKGHIIVTTKNKHDWEYMKTIETFQRKESVELLSKLINSNNKAKLDILAATLDDYPLALAQAGSFIKMNPTISIEKYIELYQQERKRLWQYEKRFFSASDPILLDKYGSTIKATLEINLNEVKKKSIEAFNLLAVLAFLSNENIPVNMLRQYFNSDDLEIAEALLLLIQYSLIDIKNNATHSDKTYTIHEVTQLVMQDMLSESQKVNAIKTAMRDLNKIIPTQLDRLLPLISKEYFFLDQIDKVCKYGEEHKIYNNDLIDLNIRKLEYFLNGKRDEKTTGQLIPIIADLISKTEDISNMTKARFQFAQASYQAWIYVDFKASTQAIELALKLLNEYPDAHEEYLMAYNRLAQLHIVQGDVDEAFKYSELGRKVVEKATGFLGNQDAFYGIRGKIFEDLGDFNEAYKNIELSEIQANQVEDKDFQTVITVDALLIKGILLSKMGQYKESYKLAQSADKKMKKIFGTQINHWTSLVKMIMAYSLSNMGKLSQAQNYIKNCIHTFKDLYSEKKYNRHYAYAYMVQGNIEAAQGNYQKAQQSYLNAQDMYNKILKKKKIDDLSYLYTKLAINSSKIKDSYSTSYYLNEHRKTFGEAHKRTFEIINYFNEHNLPIQ